MRVLVTGGSGVVGLSVVRQLVEGGHTVRLLSRHADEDVRQFPAGVEARNGDVSDRGSITGSACGCDAVLHVAGIVREIPPAVTFKKVNVDGTANMLAEAWASGVKRFVYVSSLGADRGTSAYHQSKREAEILVEAFAGNWTILRPGNVYGPGDEVLSRLLKMVRSLPAIPVIDDGEQPFQPIWHEDLSRAIVTVVERNDLQTQTLELAGAETTSMNDVIDRLSVIVDRSPLKVPVPGFLAMFGVGAASKIGIQLPADENQLTMLKEENLIIAENAMTSTLSIRLTPLDQGLKKLADQLPEQLPQDGFGPLQHKRFWADIEGSEVSAEEMMEHFRQSCADIMPIEFEAEPGTPKVLHRGVTLTAALPVRGHIQMRVIELEKRSITFATLEGHPLAGVVRFRCTPDEGSLCFEVDIQARAADFFDWVAMRTVGAVAQNSNWVQVVRRMIKVSGGKAPDGVQHESENVKGEEIARVENSINDLVIDHKRAVYAS